jgi:hypothetical protein
MKTRLTLAAVTVLLLAGCSAPESAEQPAPEPTRPPSSSANLPDIPVVSAKLQPARTPVPPTSVEVPGTGIRVSVTPVGVQPDGLMELPADVKVAGWYRFGADPLSETGTTVIAAHVDSIEYGLGPFAGLKGLAAGTEIVVTMSSGEQVRYAIESVTSVLKEQLPLADVFDRDGDPRLVLITCGGQFNYSTGSYSDNIVVTAIPVAS